MTSDGFVGALEDVGLVAGAAEAVEPKAARRRTKVGFADADVDDVGKAEHSADDGSGSESSFVVANATPNTVDGNLDVACGRGDGGKESGEWG